MKTQDRSLRQLWQGIELFLLKLQQAAIFFCPRNSWKISRGSGRAPPFGVKRFDASAVLSSDLDGLPRIAHEPLEQASGVVTVVTDRLSKGVHYLSGLTVVAMQL
ncbi:hypothetical protein ACIOZM_29610 [Pseudomonas sp. NPDC087346]|uniref:hypothetical protein n=1 Tax=Pseudomonas sp. NPDC087346 TaxID=3364438 RepID=UPI0037FA206F